MAVLNRRALSTLQKIMGAVVLVTVISGVAYSLGLFNRPPKAKFSFRTPTRTLKYIAPTDRDLIIFTNESTDPETPLEKLISNWYVRYNGTGDWRLLNSSTHHWGQLPVSNEKGHEIKLVVSDGSKEDSISTVLLVDAARLSKYPEIRLGIPVKGIHYGVGWYGETTRGQPDEVDESLEVIRNELGCNAIYIWGSFDDKILKSAEIAIKKKFDFVILGPRYPDITIEEHMQRRVEFSKKAEELRKLSSSIILSLGTELVIDVKEFYAGETRNDRVLETRRHVNDKEVFARLNSALKAMLEGCRKNFNGKITYSKMGGGPNGGWLENVDWDKLGFDFVGSDEYFAKAWYSREQKLRDLRDLKKYGLPVWITEFGCCSYRNASQYGGSGIQRFSGEPYDEEEQARCIVESMSLFEETGVDGIFLHQFLQGRYTGSENYFGIVRPVEKMFDRRKLGFYAYQSFVVA